MLLCRFSAPTQGHSHGRVFFKYKLQSGACPKSYGLHVAALAGIPPAICKLADQVGRCATLHEDLLYRHVSSKNTWKRYWHKQVAFAPDSSDVTMTATCEQFVLLQCVGVQAI